MNDFKRAVFNLYRKLATIADAQQWSDDKWRQVFEHWLTIPDPERPDAQPPPLDKALAVLAEKKKIPLKEFPGEALARVKSLINTVTVPTNLGPRLTPIARVLIAFHVEGSQRGMDSFFASLRLIGELAGVDSPMTVLRRLGALRKLGYLTRLDAGTNIIGPRSKAARYRWHPVPCPGATTWAKAESENSQGEPAPTSSNEAPPSVRCADVAKAADDDDREERAAIMAFDGGLPTDVAERRAGLRVG